MNPKNLQISILGRVHPWKGGSSHYNSELCNYLAKQASIQILSYKMTIFPRIHPWRNEMDYLSENFLKGHPKFVFDLLNPFTWKKTANEIVKFKPDLVIFQWPDPYYAIPYISIVNSIRKRINCKIFLICHEPLPRMKARFFSIPLIKSAFKKFDLLIVHSGQDYQNVKKLLPGANVKKMFHPIHDLFYRKIEKSAARSRLNLTCNNILLFFGFVRKDKGLDVLMEALPEVLKKVKISLLIVGEFLESKTPYDEKIKELGIEDDVKIVDRYVRNQEVANYFAASDAIVLPYRSSTQSGIASIAYAFNKPIIASNVGGLAETVFNGKNGYLVRPGDANELAAAIVKFFIENKQREFETGMKQAKKQHSWEVFCEELVKELK